MTVTAILAVANQLRDAVPVQVHDVVVDCKAEALSNAMSAVIFYGNIVGAGNKVIGRGIYVVT